MVNEQALRNTHILGCRPAGSAACELRADLDGDGSIDRVVDVEARASQQAGLAVFWGSGAVSVLGAGVPSRQLTLDIERRERSSHVDAAWRATELDHVGLSSASVVALVPGGHGFQPSKGAKDEDIVAAPGAVGAGLRLDGGDAAEILYWAGTEWRVVLLGF